MKQYKHKSAAVTAAFLLFTFNAFALPATLKDNMKSMADKLKTIAAQSADPGQNEDSAKVSDDFVALVENAKTFVPPKVEKLPANEQPAQIQEYNRNLDIVIDLGKQMAAAFRANNNAKAQSILSQLADAKKQGHQKFK